MTEPLVDLRALLVEREDFEGGMVGKLREGLWPRAARRSATSRKSARRPQKRLAVAAGPQQKKIHLKLGVVSYYPRPYPHGRRTSEAGRRSRWPRSSSARLTSTSASRALRRERR